MTDLSAMLEVMQTSSQHWTSLRMRGVEWRRLDILAQAWEHHVSELRKSRSVGTVSAVRFERIDGREPPNETREPWRVWLAKPDKRKAQFQVGDERVTAIFIAGWWWGWSPSAGFRSNYGATNVGHGFGPADALVDPARHLTSLQLHVDARTTFLSRPAFHATAVPRLDGADAFDLTRHVLGTGADEYDLIVDGQVGVLLRSEARYRGAPFRVVEADEIGVDESFSERVFDPESLRAGITDP